MAISLGGFSGGGGSGAVTSVNGNTGAVVLSGDDLAADHAASNYTAANANIDGHLSGIDSKLGTLTTGLTYQGAFNATAGTPSLANASQGDLYVIDTAGTIYGQTWAVGDHLLINEDMGGSITNSKIDKIDNTDQVTSVNGDTGAVTVDLQSVTDEGAETTANVIAAGIRTPNLRVGPDALNNYYFPTSDGTLRQVLATNGAGSLFFSDNVREVNGQTDVVTLSGDDLAADHVATNYTAANANIDGHLSGIDSKLANQLESGDNVSELTNDAGYLTAITGENIGDLSDVTITSAANGQVLSYDGSAWVNSAASAGSLSGLSDTTITAPADGEYLRYNGSAWVDAALSIADDTTPQLAGALDTNGNAITSASNADVTIDPNGTGSISTGADIVPDADATHTIGSETNRFITAHTDINGAVRFKAKNDEGAAISKGAVLYIKGISGTVPTVGLADANDASKMPAFGLAFAAANDQAELQVVTFGNLNDVDTSSFSAGDTLYVSTTAGALTATKPTGETAQLQNIGRVLRSDATAGIIKVGGAGRSAATPNLDQDKIFLGNASNQAVSTALSSIGLSKFNNDSAFISDITGENIGDLSDVTITSATNGQVLSYNGSAWVNSAASAGSLSGLSDVTITAAADGEYLRYNGSAWVDAALSVADDASPQLGGNLDVNSNYIVSASNGDIEIEPNGTGSFKVRGNATSGSGRLVLNCEQNTHGITIKGPPHSAAANYTLTLPNDDGNANQVLKTDGSGGLSWVDQSAGASALNDLSDVTITAAATGEVLRYNGSAWVDAVLAYSDLSGTPTNVSTFTNDAGYLTAITGENIGDLSDVTLTTPTSGQVLSYNGSAWVNAAASGGGWTYSAITADPANAQAGYHYSCTGTFTITLPTSGVSAGEEIRVKNMGTGTITIDPQTSNIDGSTTDYVMDVQYSAITLVSTGTHWEII